MSGGGATRDQVIHTVARSVVGLPIAGVVRVGIDGVDGAGKTVFADELALAVAALGRPTIRAGVDGYHNPRHVRYQRGRTSPDGYFHDSYDYATLREVLLDPLAPGGGGRYRPAMFDHTTDRRVDRREEQAADGAILVFDGIFLHRPELVAYLDYTVFLQADFDITFARMARRDGADPDPNAPSNQRYVQGQNLYLTTCRPAEAASVVIDNNDVDRPCIVEAARSG